MPKIIVTLEDQVVQEVELVKERVTIGRKAYNDIVIDHRACSGEHAIVTVMHNDAILEDLGSTNGTFLDGKKIFREKLVNGTAVKIATYTLTYLATAAKPQPSGRIEVTSGAHTGKSLALNKPLTTLGKPGAAVIAITFASGTYRAACIDGDKSASVNGRALEAATCLLADGDEINLSGTKMTFFAR